MNSHDLTALTSYTNLQAFCFNFLAKNLFINTTYAFDGLNCMRASFFSVSFIKNKKAGPARKMMRDFSLVILLETKLLLRPDAIPSGQVFIRHALHVDVED